MRKKVLLLIIAGIVLIAASLYAAGDLYVGGNLTVTGNIVADHQFQSGYTTVQTTAWKTVYFPVAFTATPAVTATGYKSSADPLFFVQVRNVYADHFEFKAVNYDGTAHTNQSDYICWVALVP